MDIMEENIKERILIERAVQNKNGLTALLLNILIITLRGVKLVRGGQNYFCCQFVDTNITQFKGLLGKSKFPESPYFRHYLRL